MFYELLKLKLPVFDVEDDRDAVFSKTALVVLIGGVHLTRRWSFITFISMVTVMEFLSGAGEIQ